ncbi:MAG: HAD-IA family hydrolase [Marinobacter sp.]|nr:HAD-IA family hydrolase [Marinobacter sp.]
MPSSVLFDLDGTLLDTAPDFIRCLNRLRQEEGLTVLPDAAIRDSVSDGARAMIQVGFGLTPEDADYARLHGAFLDIYEASVAEQTVLFPGMATVLDWLEAERIPWGIVTNKPVRFTAPLLDALGMSPRCAAVICPDHVSQRKPHPESILLACKQIGVPASTGVYVGDHLRDIEAGRNAGMITVAARYGYITDRQAVSSWGADHIVDSADALLSWLVQ